MSAAKTKPPPLAASLPDLNAAIERVTPDLLRLLADGVPRSRRIIAAALADRHAKEDVRRTLMRLAVTDQVAEAGGKYALPEVTDRRP